MLGYKKLIKFKIVVVLILFSSVCFADNHNLNEVLELMQKDLKTLERAVFSINESKDQEKPSNQKKLHQNSEDVLTRHLLKLSEIESQFE